MIIFLGKEPIMTQKTSLPKEAPRGLAYTLAKLNALQDRIALHKTGAPYGSLEQLFFAEYGAKTISIEYQNGDEVITIINSSSDGGGRRRKTETKFLKDSDYYYCPTCNRYFLGSPTARRNQRERFNEYVCRVCETPYKKSR